MDIQSTETRDQLRRRLSRVEGQVRGVNRMIEEGRDCKEIVQQLSAIRSAVQQTGLEVMRTYAQQCLLDPNTSDEETLDYILAALSKWG